MWWAIFITITLSAHKHKTVIPPQTFTTYGECQQFVDNAVDALPPLPKKATVKIRCDEALSNGVEDGLAQRHGPRGEDE